MTNESSAGRTFQLDFHQDRFLLDIISTTDAPLKKVVVKIYGAKLREW